MVIAIAFIFIRVGNMSVHGHGRELYRPRNLTLTAASALDGGFFRIKRYRRPLLGRTIFPDWGSRYFDAQFHNQGRRNVDILPPTIRTASWRAKILHRPELYMEITWGFNIHTLRSEAHLGANLSPP